MSEDSALVVTLKAGTDYASPWIVVRGDNPDDVTNKLNSLGDVIAATVSAAELFKGAGNAAPLTVPEQPQAAPAQQQFQAQPSASWGQPSAGVNGPPQQQYQQPAAPQQQSRFGGPPHPEGKACEFPGCGKVLEFKKTSSGKGTFRCPDWRWGNGNPNGHTQEWA